MSNISHLSDIVNQGVRDLGSGGSVLIMLASLIVHDSLAAFIPYEKKSDTVRAIMHLADCILIFFFACILAHMMAHILQIRNGHDKPPETKEQKGQRGGHTADAKEPTNNHDEAITRLDLKLLDTRVHDLEADRSKQTRNHDATIDTTSKLLETTTHLRADLQSMDARIQSLEAVAADGLKAAEEKLRETLRRQEAEMKAMDARCRR